MAVNCKVLPTRTLPLAGETVIEASTGGFAARHQGKTETSIRKMTTKLRMRMESPKDLRKLEMGWKQAPVRCMMLLHKKHPEGCLAEIVKGAATSYHRDKCS